MYILHFTFHDGMQHNVYCDSHELCVGTCIKIVCRRIPVEDLETAGSMMSFFLASGLGTGSLLSFALIKLV